MDTSAATANHTPRRKIRRSVLLKAVSLVVAICAACSVLVATPASAAPANYGQASCESDGMGWLRFSDDEVRHRDFDGTSWCSMGVAGSGHVSHGRAVEAVQAALYCTSDYLQANEVDGHFGPATARYVREFQREVGLPATGVVDYRTLNELHDGLANSWWDSDGDGIFELSGGEYCSSDSNHRPRFVMVKPANANGFMYGYFAGLS